MTRASFARRLRYLAVAAAMVAGLLLLVGVRSPQLFGAVGVAGALLVTAPLILASMALTPLAIAGRGTVDLSIGPLIAFLNVTIVAWLTPHGLDSPLWVMGYAVAGACTWHALTALIIIHVRVAPIIVTLAANMVLSGVNLIVMPRPSGVAPEWLANWGSGTQLFSPVLLVLVVAGLLWFVFQRSTAFEHIRIMGADEKTAFTSGIDIDRARLAAHLAAGVFAGLAAVCVTGLIGSGDPLQGNFLTLQAITALVLGGTSLAGGRGGAFGSALGAFAVFLISYVLATFNFGAVSGFTTQLAYGVILVASLQLSVVLNRPAGGKAAVAAAA